MREIYGESDMRVSLANSANLRHVVFIAFKAEVSATQTNEIVQKFGALQAQVPGIETYEWGENCSPEGLSKGHTHCFTLTFASEASRDVYLDHSNHMAFKQWIGQFVEVVTVVDYWAKGSASSEQ
jgi:Stress responsive A/B Barrel Domain